MKCRAIVAFTTVHGDIPAGTIVNIPDHLLSKLSGKVEPVCDEVPTISIQKVWPPTPKAWLTESGELRTVGIFEDLAGEIIRLTSDNMPLQAKLLRQCCGSYSGPQFRYLVEEWNERSAVMQYDGNMSRDEAEVKAAAMLQLTAFLFELRGTL